jgi:hypothetical protein
MRDYHAKIRTKLQARLTPHNHSLSCGRTMMVYPIFPGACMQEYRPDRAHLVPADFMHQVSEYGNAPDKGGVRRHPRPPRGARPCALARGR